MKFNLLQRRCVAGGEKNARVTGPFIRSKIPKCRITGYIRYIDPL